MAFLDTTEERWVRSNIRYFFHRYWSVWIQWPPSFYSHSPSIHPDPGPALKDLLLLSSSCCISSTQDIGPIKCGTHNKGTRFHILFSWQPILIWFRRFKIAFPLNTTDYQFLFKIRFNNSLVLNLYPSMALDLILNSNWDYGIIS